MFHDVIGWAGRSGGSFRMFHCVLDETLNRNSIGRCKSPYKGNLFTVVSLSVKPNLPLTSYARLFEGQSSSLENWPHV